MIIHQHKDPEFTFVFDYGKQGWGFEKDGMLFSVKTRLSALQTAAESHQSLKLEKNENNEKLPMASDKPGKVSGKVVSESNKNNKNKAPFVSNFGDKQVGKWTILDYQYSEFVRLGASVTEMENILDAYSGDAPRAITAFKWSKNGN